MNKQPTQKQIKEFWEGLGYKVRLKDGFNYWYDSDGILVNILNFPIDLNNLFKYAVSKLQDRGNNVELYAYEHKGYRATVYKDCFSQRGSDGYDPFLEPISQVKDDDPTLALFWALWQVKESKP